MEATANPATEENAGMQLWNAANCHVRLLYADQYFIDLAMDVE